MLARQRATYGEQQGDTDSDRQTEMAPPTAAEVASAAAHLDEHGWCVVKNVVSADVADTTRESESIAPLREGERERGREGEREREREGERERERERP